MKFITFANVVSVLFGKSNVDTVFEFLYKFELSKYPGDKTVYSWFEEKRHPRWTTYFKDEVFGKNKKSEIFNWLMKMKKENLFACQKEFSRIIKKDNITNYIINIDTTISEVFCLSIINQFLALFKVPEYKFIKIDDEDLKIDNQIIEKAEKEQIAASEIQLNFVAQNNNKPTVDIPISTDDTSISFSSLTIPTESRKCFYCIGWKCYHDKNNTIDSKEAGYCKLFKLDILPSHNGCAKYSPDYNKLTRSILSKLENELPKKD